MDVRLTLKLKVKDIEIELSYEDAKELAEKLNEITGQRPVVVPPVVVERPYYVRPWRHWWDTVTWECPQKTNEITWEFRDGTTSLTAEVS